MSPEVLTKQMTNLENNDEVASNKTIIRNNVNKNNPKYPIVCACALVKVKTRLRVRGKRNVWNWSKQFRLCFGSVLWELWVENISTKN